MVPSALENILQPEKYAARSCCFLANFTRVSEQTPPKTQPLQPQLIAGDIMGLSCNLSRRTAHRKEMGGENPAGVAKKEVD